MTRRVLLAALAVLALSAPAAVAASPTVIGFDDLPAFTEVVDQYAAQGVFFGHPVKFGITTEPDVCHDAQGSVGLQVIAAGISGQDAAVGCGTGDVFNSYTLAAHFDVERRGVAFDLRSTNYDQTAASPYGEARVKLWGVGKVLLVQQDVSLPAGQVVHLNYPRGGPDIVTVTITGAGGKGAGVEIDTIMAPRDDQPPLAKFEIGLVQPAIDVVEGATATAYVSVLRYNGSNGAITITVGSLPSDIRSAQVNPNPVTGIAPAGLVIAADSPFSGDRQFSVSASGGGSAGTFVGGGLVQSVHGLPALQVGNAITSVVPGCGDRSYALPFTVRGSFGGPISVDITKAGGPVQVTKDGSDPFALGNGTLTVPVKLKQDYGNRLADSDIAVTLRPLGATPVTANIHTTPENVDLVSTTPTFAIMPETFPSDQTARSVVRSDRIRLTGSFPSGCSLRVVDPLGKILSVTAFANSSPGFPGFMSVRLDDEPVTGQLSLQSPATGVQFRQTPVLELRTFRNLAPLPTANSDPNAGGSYSWGDFIRTFGSDDADICAGPLGCVRDPIAVSYWHKYRDKVASQGGLCFGYATMALRFDRGIDLPTEYTPGATRGWEVGPFFDGAAIKSAVIRWQVSQNDKNYTKDRVIDDKSVSQFFSQVRDALQRDDAAYIIIRQGGSGHAVVVYDMRVRDDGGFDLLVYNPNEPYSTSEQYDANVHSANLALSTIPVNADGTWSGGISGWKGDMSSIKVLDKLPPSDADLPSNFSLASVVDLFAAGGTGGQTSVSGIAVGGTQALRPDGSTVPRSGVDAIVDPTGIKGAVDYALTPGRSYDLTVKGARNGQYEQSLLGDGIGATVSGARTAPGQDDHVVLSPGRPQLTFASAASSTPATLEVDARLPGGVTHTATAALTAGKGRSDAFAFSSDRRTLELRHTGGATSVALTLGSVGDGAPGSVQLAALRVGAGQRLSLRPGSWADLAGGVAYTVRDARGRIVRRGRAAIRAPRAVKLAGAVRSTVVHKGAGGTVTLKGRIAKRGSSPLLTGVVELIRGRRVSRLGAASLRGAAVKAGRFSLPVRVKKLPRGARLRLTVALTDEAAGLATVRRTASVRS
jgi:hypothetical protein